MDSLKDIVHFLDSLEKGSLSYSVFIVLFLLGIVMFIFRIFLWLECKCPINNNYETVIKDQKENDHE